jgi:hypothetical protein
MSRIAAITHSTEIAQFGEEEHSIGTYLFSPVEALCYSMSEDFLERS